MARFIGVPVFLLAALCPGVAAAPGDLAPLPQESEVSSSSPGDEGGPVQDPPFIHDHVSKGILGPPPDAFEGGHDKDRAEIVRSEQLGEGIQPQYTDLIIQEARHFEEEHGLESAVDPPTEEDAQLKKLHLKQKAEREKKLAATASSPGLENMDSEMGKIPQFMGEVSATSPSLHGHMLGHHKELSEHSPVPLYNQPQFRRDLDALRYANGNYTVAIKNIAKIAFEAVEDSSRVFLGLARDMFVNEAPKGKASLANRSGFISATYLRDNGAEFKSNTHGIGCLHLVDETRHLRLSELEAEHMCNDMGLACSGYSCTVQGDRWECAMCEGVLSKSVHAWREIEKKPFFALKSPDHMEWDHVVRRSRQWVENFAAMQRQVEALLQEEATAMENRFEVMLEHRAGDVRYNHSNETHLAWRVNLDSAWREEQFQEANWYAELMKAQMLRIDAFYNQVLNKLARDANMLNDKEQAKWNLIDYPTLANHSHAFDCWMAIRGVVYDFSYLTPHHPNKHGFIKYCGRDVSQLYEDFGHDQKTLLAVGTRVIGEFIGFPAVSDSTNSSNSSNSSQSFVQVTSDSAPVFRRLEAQRPHSTWHQWHDYSTDIEAAVHKHGQVVRGMSLMDVTSESVGSVRPHRHAAAEAAAAETARLVRRQP